MDTSTVANGLPWTASLHTGDERMDETHKEFTDMLNEILATPQDQQLPLYRQFLLHTVEHFNQEERWMVATGFAAENCHAEHHATILETMTRLAEALAEWFPGHAASMDAGLAIHMKNVGFDSVTETVADPSKIQSVTMSGCGSVSCSH